MAPPNNPKTAAGFYADFYAQSPAYQRAIWGTNGPPDPLNILLEYKTTLPFSIYEKSSERTLSDMANGRIIFSEIHEFFIRAIEECEDEAIRIFMQFLEFSFGPSPLTTFPRIKIYAALLIIEYVKRYKKREAEAKYKAEVERVRQEEIKKQKANILTKLREELSKDPKYTGVAPLDPNDPIIAASKDKITNLKKVIPSNTGDITLKGIQDIFNNLSKKSGAKP